MRRHHAIVGLLVIFGALPGCGLKTYTIRSEEARRVSDKLAQGERAVVQAQDEEGRQVHLELEPGDQLEVGRRGAEEGLWLEANHLRALAAEAGDLTLYHRNAGPTLVGIGGGLLGGGWAGSIAGAALSGEGVYAIPLVGPILMATDAEREYQECMQGEGWLCLGRLGATLAVLDFVLQAVGTGLVIGGVIAWDSGREIDVKDADGETAFSFTFEPTVLGEGGAGGALTGRF